MTTTVPSLNDHNKAIARFDAIEARLTALEAGKTPAVEPPVVVPPVVIPPVVIPPAPSGASSVVQFSFYRRGRTGPLPVIVRTAAQLVADKLVLPYDRSIAVNPGELDDLTYEPGDYENLDIDKEPELSAYQGATGERREIGLVPDDTAEWVMGGSPNNMLAMAECAGSAPVHYLIDGRVVDLLKNPQATSDYRGEASGWKPFFDIRQIDSIPDRGQAVLPDIAHVPALSFVTYLATGDQYHLEEIQFAATAAITTTTPPIVPGVLLPQQQRQFAWGIRDIIAAYITAPDNAPAPLQPKNYWGWILDANIAFYTDRYVNKGGPLIQEMGFIACDDSLLAYLAPWQQDYISTVLGWAVWTGKVPQLRPLYDFQIRQAVKRATGPLRSIACQYNFPNGAADSWAAMLALNGKAAAPDGHLVSVPSAPHYPSFLRGALKLAVMNKVPGADEAFAYADTETKRLGYIPRRWAF